MGGYVALWKRGNRYIGYMKYDNLIFDVIYERGRLRFTKKEQKRLENLRKMYYKWYLDRIRNKVKSTRLLNKIKKEVAQGENYIMVIF